MVVQGTVEECGLNIERAAEELALNEAVDNKADGGAVGNRAEGLAVVDAVFLGAAYGCDAPLRRSTVPFDFA